MKTVTITALALAVAAGTAPAQVQTTPTMDVQALTTALSPAGLTVDSVLLKNGVDGQFGTYRNFVLGPVTIHSGVVLSSGSVLDLTPLAEAQDPMYDPASPPSRVSSPMGPAEYSGTAELDAYGAGHIENFQGSYDAAALQINFTLSAPSQVQFDFVFATVEYPVYTSSFTDAFCVFLDGTAPADQVAFDHNGNPVQVGASFAGLETTGDLNTAFSAPHALLHHMTTTTVELDEGEHTLVFEICDVNDQVLDSAVFIANLRTGTGTVGTDPSGDCPADLGVQGGIHGEDHRLDNNDFVVFIDLFFNHEEDADVGSQGGVPGADGAWDNNDFVVFIDLFFGGCNS